MALQPTAIPSELDLALEGERVRSLRFRFLLYCYVGIGLTPLRLIPTIVNIASESSPAALLDLYPISLFLASGLTIAAILWVHFKRSPQSKQILRIAFWLYVTTCIITLATERLQHYEHALSGRTDTKKSLFRPSTAPTSQRSHSYLGGAVQIDTRGAPTTQGETLEPDPLDELIEGVVQGAEASTRAAEAGRQKRLAKRPAGPHRPATTRSASLTTPFLTEVESETAGTKWTIGTLFTLGFIHLFTCLFLPWRFRESIFPAFVVAGFVFAVTTCDVITGRTGAWTLPLLLMVVPSVIMPGSLICWWRYSRFRDGFNLRFDANRYHQLRHELEAARQVHESCLPRRLISGPIRLDYAYEPMRSIGGDLVYMHPRDTPSPSSGMIHAPTTLLVLDVAGHGVAAALTVNRLVGEIERLFAEEPAITPADLLNSLNRYVWLTLSRYSLYVTATAAQIDMAANKIHFASAGHPTAFIRRADGGSVALESTTFLLGAVEGEDFGRAQIDLPFGIGDSLILYTDGATEARDPAGSMLGTQGLLSLINALPPIRPTQEGGLAPGAWSHELLHRVRLHRQAPPDDDTLVVVLSRAPESDVNIPSAPYVPVAGFARPV